MIMLVKYKDKVMGSQTSVRAGDVNELKYQIFFRDNLKMLLDRGYNAKSAKVRKQFEYAESIYQAQCDGTLTEDMLATFSFDTDLGGFECIKVARTPDEIDELIAVVLEITEAKRQANSRVEKQIGDLVDLLRTAKQGETKELIEGINNIHHIL